MIWVEWSESVLEEEEGEGRRIQHAVMKEEGEKVEQFPQEGNRKTLHI
jgi:hypothetical protein